MADLSQQPTLSKRMIAGHGLPATALPLLATDMRGKGLVLVRDGVFLFTATTAQTTDTVKLQAQFSTLSHNPSRATGRDSRVRPSIPHRVRILAAQNDEWGDGFTTVWEGERGGRRGRRHGA